MTTISEFKKLGDKAVATSLDKIKKDDLGTCKCV